MAKPIYEERQPIYLVLTVFGALAISFLFLTIFGKFENELVRLLLLALILIFAGIILISYQLKITVTADELILRFGNGFLKKHYRISEIDLNSFGTKKIPWYYGIGWKYDYKGNVFFNTRPGVALTFKLKHQPGKIMIVSRENQGLKKALVSAKNPQSDFGASTR